MQRRYENGEQGVQGEIEQTRQHIQLDRLRLKHQDLERQQKENNAEYKRLMTSGKVAAMNLTRSFDAVQRHLGITDGKANWLRAAASNDWTTAPYAFRTKWSIALAAVQARMTRLRESAAFQALVSMGRTGFMIAGAALAGQVLRWVSPQRRRWRINSIAGTTARVEEEGRRDAELDRRAGRQDAVQPDRPVRRDAEVAGLRVRVGRRQEKLLVIGDVAAGFRHGRGGIDAITRAMGQMQAKQKITGEEMMQLTEAGIPAWKILAKEMGMSPKS